MLTVPVYRTKQIALLQEYEIPQALREAFPGLLRRLEHFTNEGSGWVVNRVTRLWLDVVCYQPLRRGSYPSLPTAVKKKKAIINVKNKDNNCLRWSLRAVLFPADKDSQQPGKYPTEDGLNFK